MHSDSVLTFDSLVKRYRQPLAAAAYHLCGDRDVAQDIVQETLVDAYKSFESLREPDKAGPWLFAILRRKAFAHHRARKPESELTMEPSAPCPEEAESLVRGIMLEQMAQLPKDDREILAGKYLLGLSYKELGESMGINEGAVRVRCFRAKERLREILHGVGIKVGDKHGM